MRLRRHVEQEGLRCWFMVGLLALASMVVGYIAGMLIMVVFALLAEAFPGSLPSIAPVTGMFGFGLSLIVELISTAAFPALVVTGALINYQRQVKVVQNDLVFGSMASVVLDESFGHVVEDLRRERWRPNPNQVDFGRDFVGRLNHVAHFYNQYYRIATGKELKRIPYTIELNCWAEGALIFLSACPACMLLFPILLLRTVLAYPAVLAVKTVVFEYLNGKFDAALEAQWLSRLTNISPEQEA